MCVDASRQQHVSRLGSGEDLQMNSILRTASHWHARYVRVLSWLQHPFLLACRLYWGGLFVSTGFGKLTHLALTAQRFADWHIPAPYPNALAAGTTELLCGALLVLGAASRIVTVPLIVTMIVAYRTAHVDEVTDLYTFVTAPPFLHLFDLHARAAVRAGSVLDRLSGRQIHLGLVVRLAVEPGCKL